MKVIKRNYHGTVKANAHCPYQGILRYVHMSGGRLQDGKEVSASDALRQCMVGIPDGAVVEIIVKDTGDRAPGKWVLTAPGTYSLIDEDYMGVKVFEEADD